MTAISPIIPNKSYPSMKLNSRAYHSTAMSEVEKFAMDVKSLTEMQEKATVKFGHNKCFGTRVGDGFEWISFSEFGRLVQKFRNVLTHHKIGKTLRNFWTSLPNSEKLIHSNPSPTLVPKHLL